MGIASHGVAIACYRNAYGVLCISCIAVFEGVFYYGDEYQRRDIDVVAVPAIDMEYYWSLSKSQLHQSDIIFYEIHFSGKRHPVGVLVQYVT